QLQNISLRYVFEFNHSDAMLKLIKRPVLLLLQASSRSSIA
ncbi:MAG: hypothetical protein ACI9Y7_002273, partial [Dokdonia sp.]